MADAITTKSLEALFSSMNTGSLSRAMLNNLRSINHRQIPGMLPFNKDMPGLTFVTRPQLNMQADNIRNLRPISYLLNQNPLSIQTYIRCMLDPRLVTGLYYPGSSGVIPPINCPIIDNKLAFIPYFSNNILSQSGWPSISVPTSTSTPGVYNQTHTMVDGRVINYEDWDLNINVRNLRGDAALMTLYIWAVYMSAVHEGTLIPYLDYISDNMLDYNTRIYRLVLDYKKQKVTKIAAANVAIPVGVPVGDAFDQPASLPYVDANREISLRFKCTGVTYFDSILVKEFNETVGIFNPGMTDDYRDQVMTKIPYKLLTMYNGSPCYPYINPQTSELEWYMSTQEFIQGNGEILASIPESNSETYSGD